MITTSSDTDTGCPVPLQKMAAFTCGHKSLCFLANSRNSTTLIRSSLSRSASSNIYVAHSMQHDGGRHTIMQGIRMGEQNQ